MYVTSKIKAYILQNERYVFKSKFSTFRSINLTLSLYCKGIFVTRTRGRGRDRVELGVGVRLEQG